MYTASNKSFKGSILCKIHLILLILFLYIYMSPVVCSYTQHLTNNSVKCVLQSHLSEFYLFVMSQRGVGGCGNIFRVPLKPLETC